MAKTSTTTPKAPTKAQMFASIKAVPGLTSKQVAFIDHELEMLAKKNKSSTSKNPSKKQVKKQTKDNELSSIILGFMANNPDQLFTVTELGKNIAELDGMNPQKIRPLLKPLLENNLIKNLKEKGRSLYQFGPADEQDADIEEI